MIYLNCAYPNLNICKTNKSHLYATTKINYDGGKMMEERWISVDEIADHLGIKRDTVYKWIKERKLPGHKIGWLWKFNRKEVDQWVTSGSILDN